ncbi:hypothetical protein KCG46_01140 [Erythrobacter sp. WH158]|uniref:Uncharacterized protein n=2 Tax=Erythrobacter crassostreae TaxID=2828328 RepID=A0A9X1JLV7_9SPHN|nr:hypothetical protein [Erythrobacter crassostrea]
MTQMAKGFGLLAALTLPMSPVFAEDDSAEKALPKPTVVSSYTDVARLATVQGITLQWIDWDTRGDVTIVNSVDGVWHLLGEQKSGQDVGFVIDGVITEIGADYFLFDGQITIANTPDPGRRCSENKLWRFEVTQGRTYYRLREFEWCDYLTDYIDIYFAPSLAGKDE